MLATGRQPWRCCWFITAFSFGTLGRKQGRDLWADCYQGSLEFSYALVSFLPYLPGSSEVEGFTQLKKRSRKGFNGEGIEPKLWRRTGQRGAEVETPCLSGPLFLPCSWRKRVGVEEMTFVGLTSITSSRSGRTPLFVLAPIFPLLGVHDSPPA